MSSSTMWRITLIREQDGEHISVAHYSYAYAALYALDNWNNQWTPNKVILDRGIGEAAETRTMTLEEFKEWCVNDDMV